MMNIYVVKEGDSLYSIAKQFGVNYLEMAKQNEIPPKETLVQGQTIVVIDGKEMQKRGTIDVNGYAFPNIKMEVLMKTLPYLTYLSIFSHEVLPDGNVAPLDDQALIDASKAHQTKPVMVISNIQEGGFNSDLAHTILSDKAVQKTLIDNVMAMMKTKGYEGVDVDFEYILPADREAYNRFLTDLTARAHAEGYTVSTALAPKTGRDQVGTLYEAHDYAHHGETVDKVILMTYEWGNTNSEPRAVAPIPSIKTVLDYAVTDIPPEKILMGIPNYGYIWTLPYEKGRPAKAVGNYEAVDLARKYNTIIEYDHGEKAPFFYYDDENRTRHVVWFEDARSINEKLKLVPEYKLAGVSYWTVNRFFPQNWLVLSSLYTIRK